MYKFIGLIVFVIVVFRVCCNGLTINGNKKGWSRILGGEIAQKGEFHSKISIQSAFNNEHYCGGTLIDAYHVVTAGRCVMIQQSNPQLVQVMGGDLNINLENQNTSRQTIPVQRIIVHPEYNIMNNLDNDIAVLKLLYPFRFTETFYPINRTNSTPSDNTQCRIAGWGGTNQTTWTNDDLKRINISIINQRICNETHYPGWVFEKMLCAGDLDDGIRGLCSGDSGSGLICNNLLVGIASFGYNCTVPNFSSVYTDISFYNKFIDDAIQESNNNNNSTTTTTTRFPTVSTTTSPRPNTTTRTTTSISWNSSTNSPSVTTRTTTRRPRIITEYNIINIF